MYLIDKYVFISLNQMIAYISVTHKCKARELKIQLHIYDVDLGASCYWVWKGKKLLTEFYVS